MSCDLVNGRLLDDCLLGRSGIKTLYFTKFNDFDSLTGVVESGGEITSLGTDPITIYQFDMQDNVGSFEEVPNSTPENGTIFLTQNVTLTLFYVKPDDLANLNNLKRGRWTIWALDFQGKIRLFGRTRGCVASGGSDVSGAAPGDKKGLDLILSAVEQDYAPFMADYTDDPFDNFANVTIVSGSEALTAATRSARTTTLFTAGNRVETSSPFIDGTQWELRFKFRYDSSANQFMFGYTADADHYIYVPIGGASMQLAVPGNSRTVLNYSFVDNVHYEVRVKRDGLTVTWWIKQVNGLDRFGYRATTTPLTVNNDSIFDTIGRRSVSAFTTDTFLYDVNVYNLSATLLHQYTGTAEDWDDQAGAFDGTLAASNAQPFFVWSTDYVTAGNIHIVGGDYFIDTGIYTNTGITYDGAYLASMLYKVSGGAEAKIQRYNPNNGVAISSIDITGILPVDTPQGIAFNTVTGNYLIMINDSTTGGTVRMCEVDASGVLQSTVALAGVPVNVAGTLTYDPALDGGAGGVWCKFTETDGLKSFDLAGAAISTLQHQADTDNYNYGKGETGIWQVGDYFWRSNGYYVTLVDADGVSTILEIDHPHESVYAVHGEDEGLVRIGNFMYFNSDTLTHADGVLNKNVIWKFKAPIMTT